MIRGLRRFSFVWLIVGALLVSAIPVQAFAASPSAAKVSFTFDDGFTSDLLAAETLKNYGYTGTSYIATNCIGMAIGDTTTACDIGNDKSYMSWTQVAQLSTQYGWEIGSHTKSHPLTAAVDNPALSDAGLDSELSGSQAVLQSHGYNALSFASPYGDYDNRSIAAIAKYYSSHRVFQDFTYSTDPIANTDQRYSKMLTFYRIPMAFIGEIMLLCEPFVLLYVLYLAYLIGSLSMFVGSYLVITFYLLWTLLPDEHMDLKEKLRMVAYAPVMYFIMYIMNVVQVSAAARCIWNYKKVLRKTSTSSTWQSPSRVAAT